jgi:anti-sigma factor ChrR (cupin superfamily)
MNLNADFSRRVLLHGDSLEWQASPSAGVDRRMLDRMARATTIVRYAPGSKFAPHIHSGGEEFIVLDGVFQDEHGDFPAGTYVRNPPTSKHTPGSDDGCTLFVKLWQFDLRDRIAVRRLMADGLRDAGAGRRVTLLHADIREEVSYEEWAPGATVTRDLPGGAEILVLGGTLDEGGDSLRELSWLRLPPGSTLATTAGTGGAKVWIKSGHLPFARAPR